MQNNPKVSIVLLVYNHEKYLEQAINSIINQKVNFEYELIIIDDFSTDQSRKIILSYKEKHPKLIRLFFHKKNYGAIISSRERFSIARGEYICLLEGDDFWCDENKLQKQVLTLSEDESLIGCSHNTRLLKDDNIEPEFVCPTDISDTVVNLEDLLNGKFYFHTSSYLWRNIFKPYSPWPHYNSLSGDWILSMLYTSHGNIAYIDNVMSVYRIHSEGSWSKLSTQNQLLKNIEQLAFINLAFKFRYRSILNRIWWPAGDLYKQYSDKKSYKNALIRLQLLLLMRSQDVEHNQIRSSLIQNKIYTKILGIITRTRLNIYCALYYLSKGFYISHFMPLYQIFTMKLFHINKFEIYDG